MPNKFNAKGRHHIPKMKYTVRNWAEYDAALRARGSLTLWVTSEAFDHWAALPRSSPGGQCFYSDLAIETSLMLRLVFRQPLRQTEGLMASIFELLGVDLKAPDHSTVSRRAISLKSISKRCTLPAGPAHILIDSTPAVKAALKDKLLVPEATVEHTGVKDLIAQLEGVEPDGEMYEAKVKVLSEYVKHHVKEEQTKMFPKAKASSLDMVELGARMASRKVELMAQSA